MEKESYTKPEIRTEQIDLYAFCDYGSGPIPAEQPLFGICCQ